jgi:hypothetical protein
MASLLTMKSEERSAFHFSCLRVNVLHQMNHNTNYLLYCKYIVEATTRNRYYFTDSAPYSDSSSTIPRSRLGDTIWEGVSPELSRASTSAPRSSNSRMA